VFVKECDRWGQKETKNNNKKRAGKRQQRNKLHILNKATATGKTKRNGEKTWSKHSDSMIKTPNITELN